MFIIMVKILGIVIEGKLNRNNIFIFIYELLYIFIYDIHQFTNIQCFNMYCILVISTAMGIHCNSNLL